MEIDNVFADKVIQLRIAARQPIGVEIIALLLAQHFVTSDIADGRVEADVKIFVWVTGELEAKVGSISADIPVLQSAV